MHTHVPHQGYALREAQNIAKTYPRGLPIPERHHRCCHLVEIYEEGVTPRYQQCGEMPLERLRRTKRGVSMSVFRKEGMEQCMGVYTPKGLYCCGKEEAGPPGLGCVYGKGDVPVLTYKQVYDYGAHGF